MRHSAGQGCVMKKESCDAMQAWVGKLGCVAHFESWNCLESLLRICRLTLLTSPSLTLPHLQLCGGRNVLQRHFWVSRGNTYQSLTLLCTSQVDDYYSVAMLSCFLRGFYLGVMNTKQHKALLIH
jgi:hypothetical protein